MTLFLIIFILSFIVFSCRFNWWRIPKKNGFLAIMYHHVGKGESRFIVEPEIFKKHLKMLLEHGYTPLTLQEFSNLYKTGNLPVKPLLITFDDGYEDNYKNMFPIVREMKVKVNVFIAAGLIGTEKMLSWNQIHEMIASGLVGFGSHGMTHSPLRKISNEDVLHELSASKELIEKNLGMEIDSFCYPFGSGAFDKRIRPLVFKTGYKFDFSTKKGINSKKWNNKKPIKRIFPRNGETMFDFYLQITRGRSRF